MLLILVTIILIFSLVLLAIRRDLRCLLISASCLSLFLFIFAILTYIAKKGGIGHEVSVMLYGTRDVRDWFMYRVTTLEGLGFFTSIGRYSFPVLLLLTALDMSYFDLAVKLKRRFPLLLLIPLAIFICYIPAVFKALAEEGGPVLRILVTSSKTYVYAYVLSALAVLVREYSAITLPFFKRRFLAKSSILVSLAILFSFYALQDPAQIYLFYHNEYMFLLGLWYLSPSLSPTMYAIVMTGSVVFGLIGAASLVRYISINFNERAEEITLKRTAGLASKWIGILTHGTKNELLALDILLAKIQREHGEDKDVKRAHAITTQLLERIERLHRTSRSTVSTLSPTLLDNILADAVRMTMDRHPDAQLVINPQESGIQVLADGPNLSEAIANILMNAVEATKEAGVDEAVRLDAERERLWVSIKITDKGRGIDKKTLKNIWQPFYSSKNSSKNWGMGMYFARSVVKEHLGSIRYEAVEGGGSRFIILLPKLGLPQGR